MIATPKVSQISKSISDRVSAVSCAIDSWCGARQLSVAMHTFPHMEVHLAGGAVRNGLLNKNKIKDFDIFVTGADFDGFVQCLALNGSLNYGPFGSPRWHPDELSAYADIISVNRFENGVGPCHNIDDALRQFDFTANAVAINLRTLEFYDPVGGLEDAQNGVMRGVRFDYPDEPISPGELLSRNQILWIRIVHYSNFLNLTPEIITKNWLKRHQHYADAAPIFSRIFFPPILRLEF